MRALTELDRWFLHEAVRIFVFEGITVSVPTWSEGRDLHAKARGRGKRRHVAYFVVDVEWPGLELEPEPGEVDRNLVELAEALEAECIAETERLRIAAKQYQEFADMLLGAAA